MKMAVGGLFYECIFSIVICPFILLNILTYVILCPYNIGFHCFCLLNSIVLGIYYQSIWPIKEDSM